MEPADARSVGGSGVFGGQVDLELVPLPRLDETQVAVVPFHDHLQR